MSRIIFDDQYVIVIPSFTEVLPHKHAFYHIFFLGNENKCSELYVVGENMVHRMPSLAKCKLFLMIDPTTSLAEYLKINIIKNGNPITIKNIASLIISNDVDDNTLRQWVKETLHNNFYLAAENIKKKENQKDYRVIKLIKDIKEYKHLKDKVRDIANQYHLSESRLSHSFKENVGISLKGYLSIKQMEYAYRLVLEGKSITYAALEADFDSPAHLAAVCKKQMGISISKVIM